MADIQGTSLHYFIYMCIVQASSVSRPPYNIHGPPGFYGFISERNKFFATLAGKFITACLDYLSFEF